jgi:hypothetical protein
MAQELTTKWRVADSVAVRVRGKGLKAGIPGKMGGLCTNGKERAFRHDVRSNTTCAPGDQKNLATAKVSESSDVAA